MVLGERDIPDPVESVLDAPVLAGESGELGGVGLLWCEVGDDELDLHPLAPGRSVPALAHDAGDLPGVGELQRGLHRGDHLDRALLASPVSGVVLDVSGVDLRPDQCGV